MPGTLKIILGSALTLIVSPAIAYSSTLMYDLVIGHDGREFIVFMYGFMFSVCACIGGIALAIKGAEDNSKSKK